MTRGHYISVLRHYLLNTNAWYGSKDNENSVSVEINEEFLSSALRHSDISAINSIGEHRLTAMHLTSEAINQLRGILPEMNLPENGVRILAKANVYGAKKLLELYSLESYTDEQKSELSELPEDLIKVFLIKARFSDCGIKALHENPKWTEFVETHFSRTYSYTTYETVHDQDEDRFYTEEFEHIVERW